MMPTTLTMNCPHCGEGIPLPATVLASAPGAGVITVRIDQEAGKAHLAECRTKAQQARAVAPTAPQAELVGRIHRMLDMRAYIQPGASRACTLCGTKGAACLEQLGKTAAPCCAGCGNGDTHPVPKGDLSCAEWGAEFHQGGGQ